jgi:hypothetical protein
MAWFFRKALLPLGWALVTGLYLYQFVAIRRHAVDVPYWDEWEYFTPDGLPAGLSWQWLFKFHNEHRIVLTKLMAWLNLKFFGLDFGLQQLFNFGLFGCLLAAVYFLMTRVTGNDRFSGFPWFLVFLLSPLNFANHLWAFQSQFHLVLLFAVLALTEAFPERPAVPAAVKFSLLTILAIYSFSAGPVFSLVYLGCVMIYVSGTFLNNHATKMAALTSLSISSGSVGISLVFWFHGYAKPSLHPELVLPLNGKFWLFFLNLVGLGFGYTTSVAGSGWFMGAVCLVCVLLPAVLLLLDNRKRWQAGSWMAVTGIVAILALLAAITMGRANLEALSEPRYNEFAFMLIPFAALAWWLAVPPGKPRTLLLSLLWLLCCAGYIDKWSFAPYLAVTEQRVTAGECIASYYHGSGDGNCPMSYDVPLNGYLDRARLLPVKFVQKITAGDNGSLKVHK